MHSVTPTSTLAAPTATITQITSSQGLSGGAIAGVSIGGTLGLVMVSGFLWWMYRSLLRRKDSTGDGGAHSMVDATIESNKNIHRSAEIDSNQVHEMQAVEAIRRYEVDGGQNHHK